MKKILIKLDKRGLRRLKQNRKGKFYWTKGEEPFKEPFKKSLKEGENKSLVPYEIEPMRKNRFNIEFPGISGYCFESYKYMIKNEYKLSEFKVHLSLEGEVLDRLKELEDNPNIGDVKIQILDPFGVVKKIILIPDCKVHKIKMFRNFNYTNSDILYGKIIVKHGKRKFM